VYEDLLANVEKLESHYKDMQDIEFTIQEGRLFMLQVYLHQRIRSARRPARGFKASDVSSLSAAAAPPARPPSPPPPPPARRRSRRARADARTNAPGAAQCRNGKRTGAAAIKVAVDLHEAGVVTRDEAIGMVEPGHLDQLLHPQVEHWAAIDQSFDWPFMVRPVIRPVI
jgi:hypothetical protein